MSFAIGSLLSSCVWASYILSVLFIMSVVVPLSAFFRFNAELCFSSAKALNSLRGRLSLGFVVVAFKGN